METERTAEYAKALSGINYKEWEILKRALDHLFSAQIGKLKNEIQFSDVELAQKLIHSQMDRW